MSGLESDIQQEFLHWHIGGEWFTWCPETQEKIESLIAFPNLGKSDKSQIHATRAASKIVGVSHSYISDAKRIAKDAPDLLDAVRNGDLTITDAKREHRERKRQELRDFNRELVENTPPLTVVIPIHTTKYHTIVIDPPWDWGDEGDVDQFGRARPTYHTMPFAEIAALPVADLTDVNAHMYLWITNRSLPKGFALLEQWGFRYITCLTWCKPHFGMGNYFRGSTEQILFGVRGSLPLLRNNVGTWFQAQRGEQHSSKPESFYDLVETCSPGPWLEMFARRPRNGWALWGAEACMTGN